MKTSFEYEDERGVFMPIPANGLFQSIINYLHELYRPEEVFLHQDLNGFVMGTAHKKDEVYQVEFLDGTVYVLNIKLNNSSLGKSIIKNKHTRLQYLGTEF